MGMYTELVLKCQINTGSMNEFELSAFNYLFNIGERPVQLPEHPFFNCERWECIGNMSSFYHHPKPIKSFYDDYLFSRSDLKNYNDEILHFLNWLNPFINELDGKCIGWQWYEESDSPTLIYKN